MAMHQWQCSNCGQKTSALSSSNPNPSPPFMGGKCSGTSTGQHILIKIK